MRACATTSGTRSQRNSRSIHGTRASQQGSRVGARTTASQGWTHPQKSPKMPAQMATGTRDTRGAVALGFLAIAALLCGLRYLPFQDLPNHQQVLSIARDLARGGASDG